MKLIRIVLLFFWTFAFFNAFAQPADPQINVLTQNSGIVNLGGFVFVQIDVSNTGPNSIAANRLRPRLTVPVSIVSISATGHVLPANWTIFSISGNNDVITLCNGTDIIAPNDNRTIFIRLNGNTIGSPLTVTGQLLFANGIIGNCGTSAPSLAGNNTANDVSNSTIQVVAALNCGLTSVTVAAGTITCNGGTTTITATAATTGPVALEYSLNGGPFQSSNIFIVPAGTYTVTAREVNTPACVATAPAVIVMEPTELMPPIIGTISQTTCSIATGSINLSGLPSGNWTINPGAISGNTATATISGFATGIYNFTVTNAAGCTSTASASVVINAQPATPSAPIAGTITQPTCAVSTGSVALSGLPPGNWTINPGAFAGNTANTTVTGLAAGTYNFTVTNAAGCTSTGFASVVINSVPGAPAAPAYSVIHPNCTVVTGTITITSDTTGLTFSLDNGLYLSYPAGGYVVAAGIHTLTAQNIGGCTSPVGNIIVNAQPTTPAAPTISVTQPTCTIANGIITITSDITGLTFSLDNGVYQSYPASGFSAATGTHTLTAKNASGCISAVTNITVNAQLVPPTASASAGTIACNGGTTTLTVTATNGAPPYQYSLNNGIFQSTNIFTVGAGTYIVTVNDANLCTAATASLTVNQPTAISATASTGSIACNGGTVTLAVSATGGVGTLQYSLNGGPYQPGNTFVSGAGTYTVRVKDANNCTGITPAVTVTQPGPLIASATAKRITQCGGKAMVIVTATGGITPYALGVDTFIKGPGTWIFSVTDAGGCTDTTQITIEAPGCMDLHVFPNPSKNSITINHSTAEAGAFMQVFDIIGRRMIYQPVPQNAFQTTINVSKLAAGSYVVVFWNGSEKKSILFVKVSSN